jgi:hypothetical protein
MKMPAAPKAIASLKRRIAHLQSQLRKVEAKHRARVDKVKKKQSAVQLKKTLRSKLKSLSRRAA